MRAQLSKDCAASTLMASATCAAELSALPPLATATDDTMMAIPYAKDASPAALP
jgi:hypothetical protein